MEPALLGHPCTSGAAQVEAVSRPRSPYTAFALRAILLVVITVAAYFPVLDAGFVWDDDAYVTDNATLRSLEGLRQIWLQPGAVPQYYPLTFTSFWVEYHLWGLQPFGYHLVNVVLHATNAILLWLVLRRLRLPGAGIAAAIFALHPIQVESVAWITERKNVLSGLFGLAALLAYLHAEAADGSSRWPAYCAGGVLFVGALLSKTVTCTLPAVLLVIRRWQGRRIDWRAVRTLVPLFLVGVLMAGATVWMERHHVRAEGVDFALSPLQRVLVAGRALWFYPRTLLWPHSLTFIYPRWSIDTHVWWQYLFPAGTLVVVGVLYAARRRTGNGPLTATLCYGCTLAPALGFINVYPMRYSFVADHFAYLSVIALIAAAAAAGARLVERTAPGGRFLAYAMGAAILVPLGLLTARQCGIYRDLRTLWTDTLAKNPECWMAHNNLGMLLQEQYGDIDGALPHYQEALRLNPHNANAHNNYAIALAARGEVEAAIAHYEQALRLNPDFADAHENLGIAFGTQGRIEEAIAQFTQALQIRPEYAEAHFNLGVALTVQGRAADAMAHYREAIRLRPSYPEAHNALGIVLQQTGRFEEAIAQYQEALRLQPTYDAARDNLRTAQAAREQATSANR